MTKPSVEDFEEIRKQRERIRQEEHPETGAPVEQAPPVPVPYDEFSCQGSFVPVPHPESECWSMPLDSKIKIMPPSGVIEGCQIEPPPHWKDEFACEYHGPAYVPVNQPESIVRAVYEGAATYRGKRWVMRAIP